MKNIFKAMTVLLIVPLFVQLLFSFIVSLALGRLVLFRVAEIGHISILLGYYFVMLLSLFISFIYLEQEGFFDKD